MKNIKIFLLLFLLISAFIDCERKADRSDFSGIFCLNIQNLEMTIDQSGNEVTFDLQSGQLINGTGIITNDTLFLTADIGGSEKFTSSLTLSEDGKSFTGYYQIEAAGGSVNSSGIMQGSRGACEKFDIAASGIPEFIVDDFTQLSKIKEISKFRSGLCNKLRYSRVGKYTFRDEAYFIFRYNEG